MSELSLLPQPTKQTTCLEWQKYCGASCCKSFNLGLPKGMRVYKGMNLKVELLHIGLDMKWYYELHGCTVRNNTLTVKLRDYVFKEGVLTIRNRCEYLNDDLTCKGHASGEKPGVCKELSWKTRNDSRFKITDGCMFLQEPKSDDS